MGQTANCAPSRKSGCRQSVGGTVAVSQHPFEFGFTVEDFSTQLDISYPSFVAVVLKRPAAHLQPCRHLLVGEETLPIQCRAIVGGKLSDRLGRKPILILAAGLFICTAVGTGAVHSFTFFAVGAGSHLLRYAIGDKPLRLEVLFIVNIFIVILSIIATGY